MNAESQLFPAYPRWLKRYNPKKETLNCSEYRFYSQPSQTHQTVTVYQPCEDEECFQPIRMCFDLSELENNLCPSEKDQSGLKDMSYLDFLETGIDKIMPVSSEGIVNSSQWVRKYEPLNFIDLLTDDTHNRHVLMWMKSWDPIVFGRQVRKLQAIPRMFNKFTTKASTFIPIEYNYKKLILLAGPPGCGKTTLARVISRHCGYNFVEINASDDRSGKAIVSKLDALLKNKTLNPNNKPVCAIIDEVDGALDSDLNGLKQVLQYLETGELGERKKEKSKPQEQKSHWKKQTYRKQARYKASVEQKDINEEKRMTKINRPVIFICNNPYVKGLKELRGKAHIFFFNTLLEERVFKRLREIVNNEGIFIENEALRRICAMCKNDIRSAVGVLQLVCQQKKSKNFSTKDVLDRMKLSLNKDTNDSINEILSDIMQPTRGNLQSPFSTYPQMVRETPNPSLLFETFFHNMINYRNFFRRIGKTTRLYRQLIDMDCINKSAFDCNHELDRYISAPLIFYRLNFPSEQSKKIEFPHGHFERLNRLNTNQGIVDKVLSGLTPFLKTHITAKQLAQQYLPVLYLAMQTASNREEEALRCLSIMVTYGFQLAHKNSQNIFNPEIDSLLLYNGEKPVQILTAAARSLMEENYEFIKMKSQLISTNPDIPGTSFQMLQQFSRTKNRKRNQQHQSIVKYKYLEGTGTQVKYDLKMRYFFGNKYSV